MHVLPLKGFLDEFPMNVFISIDENFLSTGGVHHFAKNAELPIWTHFFLSWFVIHARAGLQSVHWLTCLVSRQIQYQSHDDLMKRKEELVSCNKMFLFYVRKFRYKGYF